MVQLGGSDDQPLEGTATATSGSRGCVLVFARGTGAVIIVIAIFQVSKLLDVGTHLGMPPCQSQKHFTFVAQCDKHGSFYHWTQTTDSGCRIARSWQVISELPNGSNRGVNDVHFAPFSWASTQGYHRLAPRRLRLTDSFPTAPENFY